MAIRLRKTKKGKKKYDAIYYGQDGKQIWKTFDLKYDADVFLSQKMIKKAQGELGLEKPKRILEKLILIEASINSGINELKDLYNEE